MRLGDKTNNRRGEKTSSRREENTNSSKLQYTLIGMCFVNEKCIDHIQQLKEDVLKKIKDYQSSNNQDTAWTNMFVIYITLQSKDLDLRLQKALLKEI